jgi:hypothetical protein
VVVEVVAETDVFVVGGSNLGFLIDELSFSLPLENAFIFIKDLP